MAGEREFWEVSVQGARVTVSSGRVGRRVFPQDKTFDGPEAARLAAAKAAAEKVNEGYVLVEGTGPAPTADPPPAPGEAPPTNPELEDAIAADPDDDRAYLVYSDWLQTRGAPRGELIAIQAQMKGQQDSVRFLELKKADAAIRQVHERSLLGGPLADVLHLVKLGWRNGFVRSATVDGGPEALGPLLDSPSAPFLQELTLRGEPERSLALLCAKRPRTLRHLAVSPEAGTGREPLGDLSALFRTFPRLRRLSLDGTGARFDEALPELARLELRGADLPDGAALPTLGAGHWPSLERLAIRGVRGGLGDLAPLAPLLEGRAAPRLKQLELDWLTPRACDALIAALAASPLSRQLERLKVDRSVFGAAAATTLLEHRAEFSKVALSLLLAVPPARLARLRKAFPESDLSLARQGGNGLPDDVADPVQE